MTTLISLIGTGQRDSTGESYQKTRYQFPDKTSAQPTAIFTGALLEKYHPQHVIILGTRTSAWAALIEEYRGDCAELYEALEIAMKAGVGDELLQQTAGALEKVWGVAVTCSALCERNVDATNASGILSICAQAIPREEDIILDITHCFRSIAMLAQAAVYLIDGTCPGLSARTQIVYGDLVTPPQRSEVKAKLGPQHGHGQVVILETLNQVARLTNAAQSIFQCLDFEPLTACIRHRELKKSCDNIAIALRSLDLEALTSVIPTFLTHLGKTSDPLLRIIIDDIAILLRPFIGCKLQGALVVLARLAYERRLWALSLFAAYEAVCVHVLNDSKVGNKKDLEQAWNSALHELSDEQQNILEQLAYARNQSAHGSHRIKREIYDPKTVLKNVLPLLHEIIS